MPSTLDHRSWLGPKWMVAAVALAALALVLSYDLWVGVAFAALLGLIVAMWLYVALRFGSLSGAPASGRHALVARSQNQASNRRLAALRTAETAARLRAEQAAKPPESS